MNEWHSLWRATLSSLAMDKYLYSAHHLRITKDKPSHMVHAIQAMQRHQGRFGIESISLHLVNPKFSHSINVG